MSTPCPASAAQRAARLPGVSRTVVRTRHNEVPASGPFPAELSPGSVVRVPAGAPPGGPAGGE
jgi:hypothetical protein